MPVVTQTTAGMQSPGRNGKGETTIRLKWRDEFAMVLLWAMSTVRHLIAGQAPRHGLAFHGPLGRTA